MDYDTYSANDAIGKVYIDLNPLLWPSTPTPVKKDSTDGSSSKEDNNKHPGNGSFQYFPTALIFSKNLIIRDKKIIFLLCCS